MTCSDPGFYGRPVIAGGSGCTRCPEGATASPGSLVAGSCYCAFGYLAALQNSSLTGNSSLTCLLSFSSTDSLARFVDLGNPGQSCSQVCAATGRSCQAKPLQGVRAQSDVQQALTAVDVSLASAFEPSASSTGMFTGLHAHYTATSWDATTGMWHDVSGNARHGVEKYEARSAECFQQRDQWHIYTAYSPSCQVVFSSLPPGWMPVITISVAKTDFESSDKYVSKVIVGGKTVGTGYLKYDGKRGAGAQPREECDSIMSKILDDEVAPGVVVDASGQLVVRIETSPATFGYWTCYDKDRRVPCTGKARNCAQEGSGDYVLYARVSIHFTEAKRVREPVKILPVTSSSGNSTTGRIAALSGASYSQVEFPKDTIPSLFTICSISRYSLAFSPDSRNAFLTFFMSKVFHHFIRMS
jgi:hypothetical protein